MEFYNKLNKYQNMKTSFLPLCRLLVYFLKCYMYSNYDKLSEYVTGCGPVYIKLFQYFSMQKGILSKELIKELSKLQDSVFERDISFYENILENNKIKNLNITNNKSIHSGSIAQVFKGTYNNIKVAVKIRHPYIKENITKDLYSLFYVINILKYIPIIKNYISMLDLDNFSDDVLTQTDFIKEANNLQTFKKKFKNCKNIIIPDCHYFSDDIIIMTWVDGKKYTDFISSYPEHKEEILHLLFCFWIKMIKYEHIIHGDIHPGNILVTMNDGVINMIVLDFGLIFKLKSRDIMFWSKLLKYNTLVNPFSLQNIILINNNKYINTYDFINDVSKIPSSILDLYNCVETTFQKKKNTLEKKNLSQKFKYKDMNNFMEVCWKNNTIFDSRNLQILNFILNYLRMMELYSIKNHIKFFADSYDYGKEHCMHKKDSNMEYLMDKIHQELECI